MAFKKISADSRVNVIKLKKVGSFSFCLFFWREKWNAVFSGSKTNDFLNIQTFEPTCGSLVLVFSLILKF